MLANILPGLWHFRTPFAVGSLFAFQIWLLCGNFIPNQSKATGFIERIYELGEMVGRAIVVSTVAAILYLLGDILKISTVNFVRTHMRLYHFVDVLPEEAKSDLRRYATAAFSGRTPAAGDDEIRDLALKIQSEFPNIRMRLIANHQDIYLEHDRLDSEAEFRMNVALYLTPLWLILASIWSPWTLFGLIAPFELYRNGLKVLREANQILAQVVVSGIVESREWVKVEMRAGRGGVVV